MARQDSRYSTASSAVYSTASVLAVQTIVAQPAEIRRSAGMSFLGTKRSPNHQTDSTMLVMIAKAELQPIRVNERNGMSEMWPQDAQIKTVEPRKNLQAQYVLVA